MSQAKPVADEATGKMAQRVAAALEMRIDNTDDDASRPLTPFDSASIPPVTMSAYLSRLARFCQCGGEAFVVALFYVDLVTQGSGLTPLSRRNAHRLYLTCLLVATKFWDDALPLNAHYAKCGGVSLKELNRLEKFLLKTIGFRLKISTTMFAAYETAITAIERLGQDGEGERIVQKADSLIKKMPNVVLEHSIEVDGESEASTNTYSESSTEVLTKPSVPSETSTADSEDDELNAQTPAPDETQASASSRNRSVASAQTEVQVRLRQDCVVSGLDVNGGAQTAAKLASEKRKIQTTNEVHMVVPSTTIQWRHQQTLQTLQPAAQKSACPLLHSEVTQLAWPSSSVPAYPGLPLHTSQNCLTRSAVIINCH